MTKRMSGDLAAATVLRPGAKLLSFELLSADPRWLSGRAPVPGLLLRYGIGDKQFGEGAGGLVSA